MSSHQSGKNTVVITGFGPFGTHPVNASWEAVRLLPSIFDSKRVGVIIVVDEIPVEYEETVKRLRALWEEHKPLLMIHVGVSHTAKNLTLESCALKQSYEIPDIKGETPSQKECCIGKEMCMTTNLQVEKLAAELNSLKIGVDFSTSDYAGRYLCEFSYYTSLCLNGQNSLFVHVPDLGKPYKPEETARGICEIIRLAVAQIRDGSCGTINARGQYTGIGVE